MDVFQRGQTQLVDLTVSDGGGANPNSTYVAGTLRKQREEENTDTYKGRFIGISPEQLVLRSFDYVGGAARQSTRRPGCSISLMFSLQAARSTALSPP